ncbi:beta-ketoacyl synthase N-terminal-like domain-containing protein [Actinokineospora sp.]|uniref:beta-ketoacyl synthase N-terminal-like domain-containing protein n=1 Tax=Actinokineospora sp. TaxID=1872133 RepID=UPI004037ADAE
MAESAGTASPVVISGLAVLSACGRGTEPLAAAVFEGVPAFGSVTRFDVSRRRATVAAENPLVTSLVEELALVIADAGERAGLTPAERADCPLLLAAHAEPSGVRSAAYQGAGALAAAVAAGAGLRRAPRAYTAGCVAASSAVADAATMVGSGRAERVVVAAGYLVDADYFALFDAGGALADDGRVRPFSAGRRGLLLGDAVVAVVVESAAAQRNRGARAVAELVGWGRAGDAHHVCRPRPDGVGLARAIRAALDRAGLTPADIGYINANGAGSVMADAAESAALRRAFGDRATEVPVSSTKSVHGHALEASALLELVATVLAVRERRLPVNAGFLGPDEDCPLNLVREPNRETPTRYALSLNSAFGGANTALLVGAA